MSHGSYSTNSVFSDGNILKETLKRKASYAWKSILHGKDLLVQGMRYVIGDGSHTNMWSDSWLPLHPPRPPRARREVLLSTKVHDYFLPNTSERDLEKLRTDVVDEDI